jgi:hypothetical protein
MSSYDLLLKVAAETLITIAPTGQARGLKAHDPKHRSRRRLVARRGAWIACRPRFFLSVQVLSRLFRRLFLERLTAAYQAGRLEFFADQAALAEPTAFKTRLAALRKREWVVYAKRPFGGPDAVHANANHAGSVFLNYFSPEITFSLPHYRKYELVLCIHHRSGLYGLINNVNVGSQFGTVGLRVHF